MLGAKKASEISIMSFSSLSKKILNEYFPDRKPFVTDAVKTVIMSIALESLSDHLEIFKGCSKNNNSVAEILHITDELIQCDVSFDAMKQAAKESGNSILIKKANETKGINMDTVTGGEWD